MKIIDTHPHLSVSKLSGLTPTEDDLLDSMNMGDLKQVVKAEHTFSELISTKGRTIFEHARNVHRVVIKMDGSANNRGLPDD